MVVLEHRHNLLRPFVLFQLKRHADSLHLGYDIFVVRWKIVDSAQYLECLFLPSTLVKPAIESA